MVKITDLSVRSHNIAIDYCNQPERFEVVNCPPVSCLATPWLRINRPPPNRTMRRYLDSLGICRGGNLTCFRVYLAVVRPEGEQPQSNLTLCGSEALDTLEAITDLVKTLQEELRG